MEFAGATVRALTLNTPLPEFVEIKTNADGTMQMEEEPSEVPEKTTGKLAVKVEIATEPLLKYNILYAEHVRKFLSLYKDKPVETREASKDEVLAVKLPSGTICGVKLHKDWPLTHKSEAERAFYDEKVAKLALEVRDLLCLDEKTLKEANLDIIPDIEMTMEDLKEISYARDIELQRKSLDRLKKEADLLTWESKIKNNLGLDKALPDAAIEALKKFSKIEKDLDALMFKKHPDVLNTVRRNGTQKNYTKEQPEAALDAISRGTAVATASKRFRVPRTTLLYKSTGKLPVHCTMGPSPILTTNEENILEKWILFLAKLHQPINKEQLLDSVQMIIKEKSFC